MLRKSLFPLGIISILGLAYFLTLAPGLSWANGGADGGDLISATFVNGIPHPTGYPLYLLIAKIFQWLPISNLAFRTNLLSAFCTIFAAVLVYQTINIFQKGKKYGRIAATLAALMFGLSPLVWSQAVITEVYGLQSLLTIGILYQTVRMEKKTFQDFLRGLLLGLALGNHITAIFLLPFLLFDKEEIHISPISHLLTRIVGLLAGASIYLILPFRALDQPAINWFNPVTIKSFIQLVSGSIYQSYFSANYVIEHTRAWAGILIENLSFPGVIIGIFTLLDNERNKGFKLLVAWIFLIYGFFALFYVTYDSYIYLIPTILAFSIWIGLSIESFTSLIIERWRLAGWILVPLVVIFFSLRINSAIPKVNASNDDRADLFGQQVFDTVPENAMIFTKDDHSTFSLWYYHFALDKRPDIKVISEGLLGFDWYRQTLRATYPSLEIPETTDLTPFHLIDQNPGNPFCFIEYPETIKINCFGNKI